MINDWIRKYFKEEQITDVIAILSEYGTQTWHREKERVIRDAVIISCGSLDNLKTAIQLAMIDYRDILISEEIDPWVISELKKSRV